MYKKVKVPHCKILLKYVLIRLLLSSAISCMLILGIYLIYGEMLVSVVISIPLIIAMCLYTSLIITRRAKDLVDVPLSKMLEYAGALKYASLALIETAKNLEQKANAMHDATELSSEVAQSCAAAEEETDKS